MKLSHEELSILLSALNCKLHEVDKLLSTNTILYEARLARNLYAADWGERVQRLQKKRAKILHLTTRINRRLEAFKSDNVDALHTSEAH